MAKVTRGTEFAGRRVGVIGFGQDIGSSRRGVDMGAYAVRAEGLIEHLRRLGHDVMDFGDVACISQEEAQAFANHGKRASQKVKYLEPIRKNVLRLKEIIQEILAEHRMPIALGGDHSMAMGTVAGLQGQHGDRLGLLWVDAHGDFNTPRSTESGNIHGMPLAVITGRGDPRLVRVGPFPGVQERHTVVFGVRDLDAKERLNLQRSAVTVISMRDILEEGFAQCVRRALQIVCGATEGFHLSFDMDGLDPQFCPGTGTAVAGGMVDREAIYLMERIYETGKLVSLDLVEVNPTLDVNNKSARLAVELIMRALGKQTM